MKLEAGMFIRDTRDGKIYKLTDFDLDFRPQKTTYDFEKASHNIIDLIEVGDYVNGEEIDFISISKDGEKRLIIRDNIYFFNKYKEIKTILTKEQFENNCYKIGD